MNQHPVRTAVVGCGKISDIYFQNMIEKYETLEVVSCCARGMESALRQGAKYGVKPCTFAEILADQSVEMLVILTPAPTHYDLIKQGLLAGKHVYTEKPIATTIKEAAELVRLANERGLYLGAAPETFLGSAVQTARKAIDDGLIGEVTSFHVTANRDLTFLASFFRFLRMPYGGICYDYGVYYLTALVSLLGPMQEVFGVVKNRSRVRVNSLPQSPEFGQEYIYDNESQTDAVLTTESGITGTFALNGDSIPVDLGDFTIHGTKGVLRLGDANQFGGEIRLISHDLRAFHEGIKPVSLKPVNDLTDDARGIGPADMARAIREGSHARTSMELAIHVLDIIEQIMKSSETGSVRTISTTCSRPDLFDGRL